MLEIGIIICLSGALFLALKNFSKTASPEEEGGIAETPIKKDSWIKRIFSPKPKDSDIISAIDKNKINIIPPSEINKAIANFNEDDPEIAKHLYEADLALMRNDLREAEEQAIEALSKDKKCAPAYVIVGKVAKERGSFAEARESYLAALKCDHEIAEALFGLGSIDFREENYTAAIDYLQKAVAIERGHADWYAELGKALLQVRQFAKAAKALKKAATLDFDNKEYKILASEAEEKMKNLSRVYRMK